MKKNDIFSWAIALYRDAVDQKDAAGFATPFTDDGTLRFGNNETLRGREAIRQGIAGFFETFESLSHENLGRFLDGDTLFLEAVVTYTRHDQKKVSIPAITVFHLFAGSDGEVVVDDCRIYVDLTPLYAP